MTDLKTVHLNDLHVELGAKMVPFAGYSMPVQYPPGVLKEHLHTRSKAGLFDVSHMGQVIVEGPDAGLALEAIIPINIAGLKEGRQRYGFLTNYAGGLIDDLMVANQGDRIFIVINASRTAEDMAHINALLPPEITATLLTDRALLALQGPEAEAVLATFNPAVADMTFMDVGIFDLGGFDAWVSRSGYTGEDGFEISVPASHADAFARALLAHDAVEPIGLGARDSLRLEAGMCLYGNDIDEGTSPIEAGLEWAIQKTRRGGGKRGGGFPGAGTILSQLEEGVARKRVGLLPVGRAPVRSGVQLFDSEDASEPCGHITSGGFAPSLEKPISMGYVPSSHAETGSTLFAELRGRRVPVTVTELPFREAQFKR